VCAKQRLFWKVRTSQHLSRQLVNIKKQRSASCFYAHVYLGNVIVVGMVGDRRCGRRKERESDHFVFALRIGGILGAGDVERRKEIEWDNFVFYVRIVCTVYIYVRERGQTNVFSAHCKQTHLRFNAY